MSYITTFDAAFFTGLILFVVFETLSMIFQRQIVLFTIRKPKLSAITYLFIWIVELVIFFSWSVAGTTTLMFWGAIAIAIFWVPIKKHMNRQLAKTHEIWVEKDFL